ncbi:UbiA family prenyltransferase [Ornithinibacillus californiensis]|uniref:UbiA family prenyltransferase n=1 Tax=Ornithinibacillus californiensis TaxID=161536 RepID=UPI002E8118EF|nr:UbiA family prenyltransferase [Ornithinibacillus californiensis]
MFTNASFMDNLGIFVLTMLGSTLVMAGALILNNWYDVDIDTVMNRTNKRPTVTGHFPLKTVLILGVLCTLLGLLLLAWTTWEAVIYALVGWFTYVSPSTRYGRSVGIRSIRL